MTASRRLVVVALPGLASALALAFALAPRPAPAAVEHASEPVVAAKRAPGPTELVIYNDDQALVREPYSLRLSRGRNEVMLEGVPRRIDSTSVRLEGDGFRVTRQSFDYDLWNGDRVFARFLGDSIRYRYAGRVVRGRLVGIDGEDLFIEGRDSVKVLTMINRRNISELEFPAREGLATRPSLRWDLESAKGGEQAAVLSYLTSGIQWTAEYALQLLPGEKEVELSGWASIVNRTGTSFTSAKVALVAGELCERCEEDLVALGAGHQRTIERNADHVIAGVAHGLNELEPRQPIGTQPQAGWGRDRRAVAPSCQRLVHLVRDAAPQFPRGERNAVRGRPAHRRRGRGDRSATIRRYQDPADRRHHRDGRHVVDLRNR
jgi:hypothetical protein